jgi:AcrR family transcriptional regulator
MGVVKQSAKYQTVSRFTMLRLSDGRRTRGRATRERVLECAFELFGSRGYEKTSIEAVLERSGVARGALYHHFSSKAELFDAVLEKVMAQITAVVDEAAGESTDPLEQMRAGARAWLELARDERIRRISLLDPQAAVGWARWRELDQRYNLGGIRAGFRLLSREGRVPEDQTELLSHILLAAMNEAALFIAQAPNEAAAVTTGRAAMDTVLDRLVGPVAALAPRDSAGAPGAIG